METAEKKKISMIPAKVKYDNEVNLTDKKIKVAAYCRVSTELEQQESSYEAQIQYYTKKIAENPNWKNAGIYADDGKSATNTKKREDFRAMIQDAMNGKIDIIITKSVSRFARNTVDALTIIRQLKEKGIAVVFEKEGVNTLEGTGEIMLTILSSLAQEESRNISENTRWGIVRKFENGKVVVNHNKFMGYTKNGDGELVIVPEEAAIVKMIFRMYLEGKTSHAIAKALEEKKIKTATGNEHWYASTIEKMLRNEKYMGDALLQKTYVVDFISKKKVINRGIVPQYYIENNHEPIIPKQLFYLVQEEIARRGTQKKKTGKDKTKQKSKYSAMFALTGKVTCGECGHAYRRVTWARNGQKKIVWRCTERLTNGVKNCKNSPTMLETELNESIMKAIHRIVENEEEFVGAFRQNVIRVIGNYGKDIEPDQYDEQIKRKQDEMLNLIEENAKLGTYNEEFDSKYKKIADDIEHLKKEQIEERRKKRLAENYEERVKIVDGYINTQNSKELEYDEVLVRKLIDNVKIISADKILIQFQSGIIMEQEVVHN